MSQISAAQTQALTRYELLEELYREVKAMTSLPAGYNPRICQIMKLLKETER